MKLALGTLLALSMFSLSSFADVKVCEVVKCGSYVQAPDDDHVSLTISFAPTDKPNEIAFGWIYSKDGKDMDGGVRLTLKLQDDGSFNAYLKDKLYASGACSNSACTYGMTPNMINDKLVLQTGTFKFVDDTLEAAIYSPNSAKEGDDFVSKGVLKKQ